MFFVCKRFCDVCTAWRERQCLSEWDSILGDKVIKNNVHWPNICTILILFYVSKYHYDLENYFFFINWLYIG